MDTPLKPEKKSTTIGLPETTLKSFITAIEKGFNFTKACLIHSLHPEIITNYYRTNAAFRTSIEDARQRYINTHFEHLQKAVESEVGFNAQYYEILQKHFTAHGLVFWGSISTQMITPEIITTAAKYCEDEYEIATSLALTFLELQEVLELNVDFKYTLTKELFNKEMNKISNPKRL